MVVQVGQAALGEEMVVGQLNTLMVFLVKGRGRDQAVRVMRIGILPGILGLNESKGFTV